MTINKEKLQNMIEHERDRVAMTIDDLRLPIDYRTILPPLCLINLK